MPPQHVLVAGCGVIGLSSAILLQKAGYAVTIIARDFPGPFETMDPVAKINYTSPWAGAHNRFVPPPPSNPSHHLHRDHAFSLTTYAHMHRLHTAHPGTSGITFLPAIEYLENPSPEYLALSPSTIPSLHLLSPSTHPFPSPSITWAATYPTYCLNPMVYLTFLLRRFFHSGGRLIHTPTPIPSLLSLFTSPLPSSPPSQPRSDDSLPPPSAVVNATGVGFNDPKVFVTRGQTVLVKEDCPVTVTRQNADGTWSFCVPRGYDGGTIIGGTKEEHDMEASPRAETREKLLRDFAQTYPEMLKNSPTGKFTVLRDIVGRRPTREGGPRVEGEVLDDDDNKFVMHAYGLGGRGYELSWGVAEAVVDGINNFFNKSSSSKL